MALNAYLRLEGEKSGKIEGSVTQKGREGRIMVFALSHDVASPIDPDSGQAAGKRRHTPLVVTKELDRASVPLHQAQTTNERFKTWELDFFSPRRTGGSAAGVEVQHFTIELTGASISSFATRMPNNKDPELTKLETYEEIAFAYEAIEWTWKDGGLTAKDEWQSRLE
jgi:type VI secretion system secreted protein Hcp